MRNVGIPLLMLLSSFAAGLAKAEPAAACRHDRETLLALSVEAFDKTLGSGWRVVGDRAGCEDAAADLIAAYRLKHAPLLVNGPLDDLRGLMRHESQLRSLAGQTEEALRLRQHAREKGDRPQQLYDDATIAFLKRDRAKLEAARQELAALPKPGWFDATAARAKARHGLSVVWPPNLDVVDGLSACFDRPYRTAYSSECREKRRE